MGRPRRPAWPRRPQRPPGRGSGLVISSCWCSCSASMCRGNVSPEPRGGDYLKVAIAAEADQVDPVVADVEADGFGGGASGLGQGSLEPGGCRDILDGS